MRKIIASALILVMIFTLSSCGGGNSEDLMKDINIDKPETGEVSMTDQDKAADFGVKLFKASFSGGNNVLVSPLSVMAALAMTANGAGGETRAQMEEVLGMPVDELNNYMASYMASLPEGEGYKLLPADSIWLTDDDRFTVNESFLENNKTYYDADIYRTAFDESTRKDINKWIEDKTDGMIPEMLKEIPESAIMYLINALAFDAEWAEAYNEEQIWDSDFNKEDGKKQKVELMYHEEHRYLENENCTGFLKYYKGGEYAFAALLPKEGMKMEDFVETLEGAELHRMLAEPQDATAITAIPKFETSFGTELSGVLSSMGMPLAFDMINADFSGIGESGAGNIFIGKVLHRTFISVTEQGTRAGAATVVELEDGAALDVEKPKEVILDRPFVYMLIDTRTSTPFFIGTLMDPGEAEE